MIFCYLLLLFVLLLLFSKNCFRNTISLSNSLDPDQDRHFSFKLFMHILSLVMTTTLLESAEKRRMDVEVIS